MTFQFLCPQGHLLEGEENLAGGQLTCPLCQTLFIVPDPPSGAPHAQTPADAGGFPGISTGGETPQINLGGVGDAMQQTAAAAETAAAVEVPEPEPEPEEDPNRIVRVICPEGHELHTPMSMLGQDAMCPHCETQFQLRYEDTLEYKEEQEARRQKREEAFNQGALKWSIAAAVLVSIGLITMIVLAVVRN